jgi:very-short-patch-repair endonuclease
VMFLSMVAAGPSQVPLTRELYVQRYNVAASRARDQMWLFHSIPPGSLDNAEDMRFQLLDHCYGMATAPAQSFLSACPADTLVEPFESLFPQHVASRLVELGYAVVPRFPVDSAVLDLVVVGARARLAVVCEGDEWRGPAAYERDLARHRDLERCGWRFFRIRASSFYVSPSAVLDRLVTTLRALEIEPRAPRGHPD